MATRDLKHRKNWSPPASKAIEEVLREHGPVKIVREASGRHAVTVCPVCGKKGHCYVNLDSEKIGLWDCKRCGASGGLKSLRDHLGNDPRLTGGRDVSGWATSPVGIMVDGLRKARGRSSTGMKGRPMAREWTRRPITQDPEPEKDHSNSPYAFRPGMDKECREVLWGLNGGPVRDYLMVTRRLSEDAIRKYRLGAFQHDGVWMVAIPIYDRADTLVNMRFRPIAGQCPRCHGTGCADNFLCDRGLIAKKYLRCPGRPSGLFGVNFLPKDLDTEIIVTEGELDVPAMWDIIRRDGIVSGTTGAGNWSEEWSDDLEPYRGFLLAYDNDQAGHDGAEKVAEALGRDRCSRVLLPYKDAGECLVAGVGSDVMGSLLAVAQPMIGLRFVRPGDMMDQLEKMIEHPDDLKGLPTSSTNVNKCVGGLRPGLWVVTGETSSGKTTWTTWLLWDQACRGIPVLATSFEQRPIGTMQKFLRMQMGGDFTEYTKEERRAAGDALNRLPITILDHYGHLELDDLIRAIKYARRRLGVRVAQIDHMGFIVHAEDEDGERFAIEKAIRELMTVAVQDGICLILIVHPNRSFVQQQRRVRISDCKGASAIEQDAHVGAVVQRLAQKQGSPDLVTVVHFDKVREEWGIPGSSAAMFFDFKANRYSDNAADLPISGTGARPFDPMKARRGAETEREPDEED